jgi:hypothetical protein
VREWLPVIAGTSLGLALACALIVAFDILAGHRQRMWIMNVVWPITALYGGPLALWFYLHTGRAVARGARQGGHGGDAQHRPRWQTIALAATHCGSGCTLGDIVVESALAFFPLTLFGHAIFAAWGLDYVAAFIAGIAFQYLTIAPMRRLSPWRTLLAALKADALSLTAWQVGMYGWMAVVVFVIFGHELGRSGPEFWFMMQIAMLAGFVTSYPVNAWLLKTGVKESM